MKVRIGFGTSLGSPADLVEVLDTFEPAGFDSIWLPEVLTGDSLDPLVALAYAAARYPKLKLGTTILLPGRHILRLANQLAALDSLSGGRLLVTFVPGINSPPEGAAIGVAQAERRSVIEEALPLLRRLLSGAEVSYHGRLGTFDGVRLAPLPQQRPIEFWLGGTAPRSLELAGRLGEGWLPSLCTPTEAAAGKRIIEQVAADNGRAIDPEHFGVSIGYGRREGATYRRLVARVGDRPLADVLPDGLPALRSLIERYVEAGFSKFVVRPLGRPASWSQELEAVAAAVLDLQT